MGRFCSVLNMLNYASAVKCCSVAKVAYPCSAVGNIGLDVGEVGRCVIRFCSLVKAL